MSEQAKKNAASANTVRLDKWLWAARFYKTRAIAKAMIEGGKVYYNGQRSKSGKNVAVGDKIKIRQGFDDREVNVLALSEVRRDASFAQTLYSETAESIKTRDANNLARKQGILLSPAGTTKPTKKERRKILQFKERI